MKAAAMNKLPPGAANRFGRFIRDRRGNAAVEFAFVVPLMLALFFGTVEFSSAVSAQRKSVLATRTMSDLVSQSSVVDDNDLQNFYKAAAAIMYPFPTSPDFKVRITSLYVDPTTKIGKPKWSKAWGTGLTALTSSDNVTLPTALQIGDTYLIYAEVKYKYVPAVGYMMDKLGRDLDNSTYTRPRQSLCTKYPATAVSC
jgi:Flp pilus assembly protein TadG